MLRESHLNRVAVPLILAVAFFFVVAISPSHAAAQTVPGSIRTSELLPPGQNTCQATAVTDVEPHVYGGVLESFDVTISDTSNSYVGITAQVASTQIPLNFISRWAGSPSGLRIHVDTPDITVYGDTLVTLTLLASPSGDPTCITTVSFEVGASTIAPTNTTPSVPQSQPPYTAPSQTTAAPTGVSVPEGHGTAPLTASTSMQNGSTTALGSASMTSATNMGMFGPICANGNAYRLWFLLLLIYIVIVAVVVFDEPWFLEGSVLGSTSAILIPLILLLAFWYFSETCRAASWIPVLACVIAIVGLFLAFREYETLPLLPAATEQ